MDLSVISGDLDDYTIGDFSFYKLTNGASVYNITGFSGGVNGKYIIIVNTTSNNQTFQQESTDSLEPNRLVLGTANKTINPNQTVTFIYVTNLTIGVTSGLSRWVLTSSI